MKKFLAIALALVFVLGLAACSDSKTPEGGDSTEKGEVSVFYYTYSDTYISSVRSAMDKLLTDAGIKYQNYDANNNQTTQTEQVTTAIAKNSSLLIVNVVDTGSNDAAQNIIDLAKAKNIPVIFFNRSVEESVVSSYDKCVFVGTDYEMAGHMQGEMVGNYVAEHFANLDLNGDGKISYVMFKGDEANVEAIYRTQFGVEDANAILTAAGKPELEYFDAAATTKYQVDLGGAWSAQAALDYMNTNLSQYNEANGNMIELVICNNDNMAEGAISALEAAGYNTGAEGVTVIPVFGVDATDSAKELIASGKMTGTVKQDAEGMAAAIAAVVKANGEGSTMADAIAATASLNDTMYSVADGIANKLFVAYAAYTK